MKRIEIITSTVFAIGLIFKLLSWPPICLRLYHVRRTALPPSFYLLIKQKIIIIQVQEIIQMKTVCWM